MTIKKVVLEVTVLFDEQEVSSRVFENGTFNGIECEVAGGSLLMGKSKMKSIESVSDEKLVEESIELGNDGRFFRFYLDEGLIP